MHQRHTTKQSCWESCISQGGKWQTATKRLGLKQFFIMKLGRIQFPENHGTAASQEEFEIRRSPSYRFMNCRYHIISIKIGKMSLQCVRSYQSAIEKLSESEEQSHALKQMAIVTGQRKFEYMSIQMLSIQISFRDRSLAN